MSNNRIISNFLWRFLERSGAQGVNFIVSIVLARLLEPEAYGTIAMITVFISILGVFIDSGMGNALIQKKNVDDLDFSSVFYFNIIICICLYAVMFVIAPFIASFYAMPALTPLIRVLSLTLIISGVKNIQQAYVSRNLLFKRFFFATLGGTLGAAFLGIWMAYKGFGVWSLVAQNLFNSTIDTIILWITVKWRPVWQFSFQRLKILLSYGWKLLVSSLIYMSYINLRSLVIGKFYNSRDLAFYNRGGQFPQLILMNINSSLDSVLFPVMAQQQNEPEKLKALTCRAIKISMYIMAPMMIGLTACAEPLVRLVLTEKWLPSVFYLRIACIATMVIPISTAHTNSIQAIRSDIILKLQIVKRLLDLIVLFLTAWISVKAMAWGLLFSSLTNPMLNALPTKKLFGYSFTNLLKDVCPSIFLALAMGICIYPITLLKINDICTLIFQMLLGFAIYTLGSRALHFDSYEYVVNLLRQYLNHGAKKIAVKK